MTDRSDEEMLEGALEDQDEIETAILGDPTDEPERVEDFEELGDLLAQATAQSAEEKRLKTARKRLVRIQKHNHPDQAEEQKRLVEEILRLEEKRVWQTIGCVALFYTQKCGVCDSKHDFFMGWFTVRTHATDKHLRDMKAGEPVDALPRWVEVVDRGTVPVCANCCELRIAAEVAMGTWPEVA